MERDLRRKERTCIGPLCSSLHWFNVGRFWDEIGCSQGYYWQSENDYNIYLHKALVKGKDLIMPAITHFITAYLTLGCLNRFKGVLMSIFTSKTWITSKFVTKKDGKKV